MFKRILVPLDGSARAEEALPVAARIARASGGSIHLLEVFSPPIDYGGGLAMVPFLSEQLIEAETTTATDYLQTAATSQMLTGIQITIEALFGIPAQCILATAAEGAADLIVSCSHGRTGFARWALGSVAHILAHESTVPTLFLRENEPASPLLSLATARPLRALVPLDGSQLAEAALAPAASLAPGKIAHTLTIPQLKVNVLLPGDGVNGKDFNTVTFTFHTGAAGTYTFRCLDLCGTGPMGMMGTLTVQ